LVIFVAIVLIVLVVILLSVLLFLIRLLSKKDIGIAGFGGFLKQGP